MLEEIDFMFCRITMFLDEHYSVFHPDILARGGKIEF